MLEAPRIYGDNLMFAITVSPLLPSISKALPTMRSMQNAKRQIHPRMPGRPCLHKMKSTDIERQMKITIWATETDFIVKVGISSKVFSE